MCLHEHTVTDSIYTICTSCGFATTTMITDHRHHEPPPTPPPNPLSGARVVVDILETLFAMHEIPPNIKQSSVQLYADARKRMPTTPCPDLSCACIYVTLKRFRPWQRMLEEVVDAATTIRLDVTLKGSHRTAGALTDDTPPTSQASSREAADIIPRLVDWVIAESGTMHGVFAGDKKDASKQKRASIQKIRNFLEMAMSSGHFQCTRPLIMACACVVVFCVRRGVKESEAYRAVKNSAGNVSVSTIKEAVCMMQPLLEKKE